MAAPGPDPQRYRPTRRRTCSRSDDRTPAVAAADELKQELSGHAVEGEVPHLIQDKQPGSAEGMQPMVEVVFFGIRVQLVQQIHHGREIDTGGLLDSGHA